MGRYTAAQQAGVWKARDQRGAGNKYGYTYDQQGFRDAPDQGGSAYRLGENYKQFGRFGGGGSWQQQIGPNGQVQWKARSQNPDRVRVTVGDWFDAPEAAQRSYQNTHGPDGFFTQHPDASWQDWAIYKGGQQQTRAQGWTQNEQGNWVNPRNQYDMRDSQFRRLGQDGSMMNNTGTTNWMSGGGMAGGGSYNPWGMPSPSPSGGHGFAPGEPTPGSGMPSGSPYGTPSPGTFMPAPTAPQATADLSFDPEDPYGYKKRKGNSSLSLLGEG